MDPRTFNALRELDRFINNSIQEEDSKLASWYKESRWYRKPTLKDVFGQSIADDISRFKISLKLGSDDIDKYVSHFEECAKMFGKSWYDEDLGCERCGYEYETMVCTTLRNIAAMAVGKGSADYRDFYEGYGSL